MIDEPTAFNVGDIVTGGVWQSVVRDVRWSQVLVEYSNGERSWWDAHKLKLVRRAKEETIPALGELK
jgi:hypothetical protein